MGILLVAYAVAWAMVTAYVLWIAAGNVRLAKRLERLEMLLSQGQDNGTRQARAA